MGGPLDPLGQGVDVEPVVVELGEDRLQLGQGLGVAGLGGGRSWRVLRGSARLANSPSARVVTRRGAGRGVGGGADEVAGGGAGDGPASGQRAGRVVGVDLGGPLDQALRRPGRGCAASGAGSRRPGPGGAGRPGPGPGGWTTTARRAARWTRASARSRWSSARSATAAHASSRSASHARDPVDQPGGARRGGLQAGVGHLVGHGPVDLVAEPGDQRDRQRGDGPGDALGVEGGQVGAGPAAPDEGDDVGGRRRRRPRARRRSSARRPGPGPGRRAGGPRSPARWPSSSWRKSSAAALPWLVSSGDPQRRADERRAGRWRPAAPRRPGPPGPGPARRPAGRWCGSGRWRSCAAGPGRCARRR